MTTISYAQVLNLARQLPPRERVQLAAEVLATVVQTDEAWDELNALVQESKALPPLPADSAELLSASRR